MTQFGNYIFTGRIVAEAPLATCSADLKSREAPRTDQAAPVPHTMTAKGKRLMFPATGIRGALRRRGRDVLREAVIGATGSNTPFSLDEHYFLTLGGVKGKGEAERASVLMEAEWRRKNPLLSLFGAGDAGVLGFVHGRVSVGNAVAVDAMEPVTFSGARTDDFYRDTSQVDYLSESDAAKLVCRANGGRARSVIEKEIKDLETLQRKARRKEQADDVAELKRQIDEKTAAVQKVKGESGTSDVAIGQKLAGWQAIPEGCEMSHRMMLMRSSDIELGFLLHTLNAFAMEPLLGAHFAVGHGLVSGNWDVEAATLSGRVSIGRVSFTPFCPLVIEGESLTAAWDRLKEFLASDEWDFSIPKAG